MPELSFRMDLAVIARRLDAYERLIRLDKPIGTLLLLWPTLWAVWLASGGDAAPGRPAHLRRGHLAHALGGLRPQRLRRPRLRPARGAHARLRPLAARRDRAGRGAVARRGARAVRLRPGAASSTASPSRCPSSRLPSPRPTPSPSASFPLPQAVLGIAFGFGIPMAYAAIQERLPLECWLLLAANVFYSFAYDTEYAMVDRDDDAKIGIRTSALTLGQWDVAAVMASYLAHADDSFLHGHVSGPGVALPCRPWRCRRR